MSEAILAQRITVTGVVQGVGFRPFVYNLATRMGLSGWVLNHASGVDIEVQGSAPILAQFLTALREEAPPLAHITSLTAQEIPVQNTHRLFEIRQSDATQAGYQLISPDIATCPACLRELFDPFDRRYRYPFINCTSCGPRFTIIQDIPYDRPATTMRAFPLCPACQAEYDDPSDRRFHAQPNACPVCGPHVWFVAKAEGAGAQDTAEREQAFVRARELLLGGAILAVKGLGGFHLACDATNPDAVALLRERKRRPHKPFAITVENISQAKALCEVSSVAEALLTSPQCPIVLLPWRAETPVVAGVAPNSHILGVMLPSTPLHHILMRDVGRPLVMTSGNLSEEPIAQDNNEALRRLSPLADGFLLHNRDIYARYDDSVWQILDTGQPIPQPVRRARGYAPFPIQLPFVMPQTFATGPLLKATFTLTRDANAFLSQHIGDLENMETLEHYEATLGTFQRLFRIQPERVACDLHPDYLSTRFARSFARQHGLPDPIAVQHHKAHIAACLVDNGWSSDDGPVIGVAFDGTGLGEDGAIWGGEWFVGDYAGLRRAAHLEYLPLPGGDAAIRYPWRIAAAYSFALLGEEGCPAGMFCPSDAMLIHTQIGRKINTPLTSSMGRLFDAVSALLGVCSEASYEAQAAIELEQLAAAKLDAVAPYPFELDQNAEITQVRLASLFDALLSDTASGLPVSVIATRFHATVAAMIVRVCEQFREQSGINTVALSGGVFQNRLLCALTVPALRGTNFDVLIHHAIPSNDGGISVGQAVLAHFMPPEQGPVNIIRGRKYVPCDTDTDYRHR